MAVCRLVKEINDINTAYAFDSQASYVLTSGTSASPPYS